MNAELTKTINNYYCNVVRTSAPDRTGSKEDANLYLLAFWGLVKCGYPFRVAEDTRSEDGVEAGDGHKPGKEEVSAGSQPSDTLPKRIVQLMIDDVLYTCEEERLAARFGSEFVSAILDAQPLPVDSDKNEDDDFNLPFARFDEDEKEKHGPSAGKEPISQKAPNEPVSRIPYVKSDSRFPDDMPGRKEYDTFLFNYHDIKVAFDNGTSKTFSAIVYPVYMDMDDTLAADILCVITDEKGRSRCGMSDMSSAGQKGVNAEFDGLTIIVRGEWAGGEFFSDCKILSVAEGKAALKDKMTKIRPSVRTSSFYLRYKGSDGTFLNVFPLSLLRNDAKTGLAQTVMMVEDGNMRKLYAVDGNTHFSIAFDGSQQLVEAYWSGNALRLDLEAQT